MSSSSSLAPSKPSPSKINNIHQQDSSSNNVVQPQPISSRNSNKNNGRRTLPKLVVHVKRVLSEESLQVHVKRFGKVQLIKKKVKKMTGIPMVDQTLVLSGRQLENTERIISLLGTPDVPELTVFLVCKNAKKAIENSNKQTETKSNEPVPAPLLPSPPSSEEVSSTESIQKEQESSREEVLENKDEEPSGEGSIEKMVEEPTMPTALLQDASPFSCSSLVVVKLTYEGQHRRVPLEGASFSRLTSLCTTFFGIKNVNRMILRYQDEDGDLVQLSSDYELAYALATQACPSKRSGTPVLRFVFSVKPAHPKVPSSNTLSNSSNSSSSSNESNLSPKEERKPLNSSNPSEMRRLRDGDLIQLSNGGFNVVLARSQQVNNNNNNNNFLIEGRKDDQTEASQWIVKKAQLGGKNKKNLVRKNLGEEKAEEEEEEEKKKKREVIFLRNKTLSNTNKNLRANPTGELQHTGASGKWARFVVHYLPNEGAVQLRSIGRSLLRDLEASSSSFLGIAPEQKVFEQKKKTKKNNKNQTEREARVVKGTFKKKDDASKFALRFVE